MAVKGAKALEIWARRVTDGYPGVRVTDMSKSWKNGLAFCAIVHRFRPDLIDFYNLDPNQIERNCSLIFSLAEAELGIPSLLDPTDMAECKSPDRLSILTYLSEFYHKFKNEKSPQQSPEINKKDEATEENEQSRTIPDLKRKDSCDSGVFMSPLSSVSNSPPTEKKDSNKVKTNIAEMEDTDIMTDIQISNEIQSDQIKHDRSWLEDKHNINTDSALTLSSLPNATKAENPFSLSVTPNILSPSCSPYSTLSSSCSPYATLSPSSLPFIANTLSPSSLPRTNNTSNVTLTSPTQYNSLHVESQSENIGGLEKLLKQKLEINPDPQTSVKTRNNSSQQRRNLLNSMISPQLTNVSPNQAVDSSVTINSQNVTIRRNTISDIPSEKSADLTSNNYNGKVQRLSQTFEGLRNKFISKTTINLSPNTPIKYSPNNSVTCDIKYPNHDKNTTQRKETRNRLLTKTSSDEVDDVTDKKSTQETNLIVIEHDIDDTDNVNTDKNNVQQSIKQI